MLIKEIREKNNRYLELFAPPNHGLVESSKKYEGRVSYSQSVTQYLCSHFLFSILLSWTVNKLQDLHADLTAADASSVLISLQSL